MTAEIPTQEPAELRAGDTWKWNLDLADFPAGTWTLKYRFKNAASGFEITAGADGTTHAVSVAAAVTADYAAGGYDYVGWVEAGAEKYTLRAGRIDVLANFRGVAAAAAHDGRSHAKKMLDAIEAWLENHDQGVAEYEIAGRRMKYYAPDDLLVLRDKYRREVRLEEDARRAAAGLPSRAKLVVRFGRPT